MKILAALAIVAALAGCMGNTNGGGYNPALAQALANIGNQWQGRIQHQQMLNMQQQLYNQQQRQTTRCSTLPNGFGGFQMVCQ